MNAIISELESLQEEFLEYADLIDDSYRSHSLVLALFEESDNSELKEFLESSKKESGKGLKTKISEGFDKIKDILDKFKSKVRDKLPKIKQKPKTLMDQLEGKDGIVQKTLKFVRYDDLMKFYAQAMDELRILTVGKNTKEQVQDFFAKFLPWVRKKRDEEAAVRRKCAVVTVGFMAFGVVASKIVEDIEKTSDDVQYKCSKIKKEIDKNLVTVVKESDDEESSTDFSAADIERMQLAILREASYFATRFAQVANQQIVELENTKVSD